MMMLQIIHQHNNSHSQLCFSSSLLTLKLTNINMISPTISSVKAAAASSNLTSPPLSTLRTSLPLETVSLSTIPGPKPVSSKNAHSPATPCFAQVAFQAQQDRTVPISLMTALSPWMPMVATSSSTPDARQLQDPQHVLAGEAPPRRIVPIVIPVGRCLRVRSDSGRSESGAFVRV